MSTKRILYLLTLLLLIASGSFVFSAFSTEDAQVIHDNTPLFDTEFSALSEEDTSIAAPSAVVPQIKVTCTNNQKVTSLSTTKTVVERPQQVGKKCEVHNVRKLDANASINFLVEQYNVVDITDTSRSGRKSFSVTFDSFSATLTKVGEEPSIIPIAPVINDLESSVLDTPTFPGADLPAEVSGAASGTTN